VQLAKSGIIAAEADCSRRPQEQCLLAFRYSQTAILYGLLGGAVIPYMSFASRETSPAFSFFVTFEAAKEAPAGTGVELAGG
jgi:hypothetical protein